MGDRLSGWSEIFSTPSGTSQAGSRGLIKCLRDLFSRFGVPEEISSDGGPEFSSSSTNEFLKTWDVTHRIASAYYPRSNGRAEVAVKQAKRLLRSNVNESGSLDSDKFLTAMLQLRNTPDSDCQVSPAEIMYGRQLRDGFAFLNKLDKFSNPAVRPVWREAWKLKEEALRTRFVKNAEAINHKARKLRPLYVGSRCLLQNQGGAHPRKWDRSGVVMEVLPHDQFVVRIDGSRRLTRRNRRFLRMYKPVSTSIEAKAFHGWRGNLPSSQEGNVRHQRPDSPVKVTEDSNGANTGETSEVEADHEEVEEEYIPTLIVPIKNKVPLALRRLKDFNAPGKLESGVLQSRNHRR